MMIHETKETENDCRHIHDEAKRKRKDYDASASNQIAMAAEESYFILPLKSETRKRELLSSCTNHDSPCALRRVRHRSRQLPSLLLVLSLNNSRD